MATVLIVEDESQVLTLAESVLREAGYNTITASTVAEAQAIIHSEAQFDLICTNVVLGAHDEGGITIGQLAMQRRPGKPVLYTSSRAVTDGMRSLFVEKSAFLQKPYTAPDLLWAIANLLRTQ